MSKCSSWREIGVGIQHIRLSVFIHLPRIRNWAWFVQTEENRDWVLATSNYGVDFISAVRKSNVYAVQFHPEKSGGKTSSSLFIPP